MSKETIEQKGLPNISVHKLEYLTVLVQDGKAPVDIHKSKATTVAKAICPEYQKVIDQNKFLEVENDRLTKVYQKAVNKTHELNAQNAKLVEALEGLVNSNPIHEGYHEKKLKAIEALQNTKNIEG